VHHFPCCLPPVQPRLPGDPSSACALYRANHEYNDIAPQCATRGAHAHAVFTIGPASSSANGTVRPKTGPYGVKPYRAVPGSRSNSNSVYGRTHGTVRRAPTAAQRCPFFERGRNPRMRTSSCIKGTQALHRLLIILLLTALLLPLPFSPFRSSSPCAFLAKLFLRAHSSTSLLRLLRQVL
jgi:hypothetical protein